MNRCGVGLIAIVLFCVAGCTSDEMTVYQPDLTQPVEPIGHLDISLSMDTTTNWAPDGVGNSIAGFFLQGEYFEDISTDDPNSYSGKARGVGTDAEWSPWQSTLDAQVWRGEDSDVITWRTEELPLGTYTLTVIQILGEIDSVESYEHHTVEVTESSNAYMFQFPLEVP